MSWLLLFLVHNMAISIFRAIGAIARNIVVANACGSMMLMTILMLGGFVTSCLSVCVCVLDYVCFSL